MFLLIAFFVFTACLGTDLRWPSCFVFGVVAGLTFSQLETVSTLLQEVLGELRKAK